MTLVTCIAFVISGIYSIDYLPPPDGIGSEVFLMSSRSYGMGGIGAGLPDNTGFSMQNPVASAWTLGGGI